MIAQEASQAPQALRAALNAGINSLSNTQQITFQAYRKNTIPVDGYVFWVAFGDPQQFTGSLHQITERFQDEDQTISINKIIFTSEAEITAFNQINTQTLMVGSWVADGVTLQVVFNDQAALYKQAGVYHYSGDTVYPALASQLIQSLADLPIPPIVSNSLPIWLAQNSFAPVYPSFLVPSNIEPPYISCHIPPEETEPLGQFPQYQWPQNPLGVGTDPLIQMSSSQLMRDTVKLTLYGFTNQMAIQYLSSLFDYSLATDEVGFCNSPVIRDDKRIQSEISALAMKKTIMIQASYYQATADAVARRLILTATMNYTLQ